MFNKTKSKVKTFAVVACGALLVGLALTGCKSDLPPAATAPATEPPKFALFGPPPVKSGVELWSETCSRCHNMRPTNEFSGQQWAAVVQHMRFRANLTGEEARKITDFLKAGS